jgi:hypothetical protein
MQAPLTFDVLRVRSPSLVTEPYLSFMKISHMGLPVLYIES